MRGNLTRVGCFIASLTGDSWKNPGRFTVFGGDFKELFFFVAELLTCGMNFFVSKVTTRK